MPDNQVGLGRIKIEDPRDKQYLMPRRVPVPAGTRSRMWYSRGVLDQGATSQCVAYAGTKYLTSGPIMNTPPAPPATIYTECQKVDEWPGENYDGTSVRALFKVLQGWGIVGEYRWAFEVEPVIEHLLARGPVVMGTNWHREMFTPDRWGYIQPSGPIDGGHAWLLIGASRDRKNPNGTTGAVRMVNSWGPNWGEQSGRAWITFAHLDMLIKADGEACTATEIKK